MKPMSTLLFSFLLLISCSKDDGTTPTDPEASMYFPPKSGTAWETTAIAALGWHEAAVQPLKDFLIEHDSKSFMILINGRIVMEEYFNDHTAAATWAWNSSGKGLVSATIGIAQQEGLLGINDKVSVHLGTAWANMPLDKENLITIKHLLSMTSGIDDSKQWVTQANLTHVADAGTRWAYGNVFQRLMNVVSEASDNAFETYFDTKLKNKIGMDGYWHEGLIFTIYHSTTRSMARFGLLALNKGKWGSEQVIADAFFTESVSTSQSINPAYGYLWWLNGKAKYMLPSEQTVYTGALVPNAPAGMYAAMGANDQRIYVVPSKNMVVIRMGEASDPDNPDFAVSGFDNVLWEKINAVIE